MLRNDKTPTGTGDTSPVSLWKCTTALMAELPTFTNNYKSFQICTHFDNLPNFTISAYDCQFYQYLEDMPEFTTTEFSIIEEYYDYYEPNVVWYLDEFEIYWVDWEKGLIKFRKFSRLN